jgi:hypothetical protein
MIDRQEAREILLDLLEEIALLVGGILAVHRVDDDMVWKLMSGMDRLRRRGLGRLNEAAGEEPLEPEVPGPTTHPAVEEFLIHIQRDRKRCASRSG